MKNRHTHYGISRIAGFLLTWLLAQPCLAQSPQRQFDLAGGLYGRQQYDSASSIYDRLISEGYHNAVLYYDAGNASFQGGRLGESIYYFNKAKLLDPGNMFISQNLLFAERHIADHIESIPPLFFVSWGHELVDNFSTDTWMILSLSFFWGFILFLGCRLVLPRRRALSAWLSVLSACFFVLSLTCSVYHYRQISSPGTAIVMQPLVRVREAPDKGSGDAFEIHEGLKVRLLDKAGGWEKIRLKDGRTGWTTPDNIRPL